MRNGRGCFSLLFLLIVAFLLLPSVCFASFDATFRQSPGGLLVSLSDTNYWRHYDNAVWIEGDSGNIPNPYYYYDNQILCSIELDRNDLGGDMEVNLAAELLSNEWCYVLNSGDSKYKRPFGIQIMARGLLENGTYSAIGYGVSIGGTISSVTGNLVIPDDIASMYNKIIYDVVLVFDKNVDTTNDTVFNADGTSMYPLIESDSYYSATIRLSVRSAGDLSSYDVYLNGYYNPNESKTTLISNLNMTTLQSVSQIIAKDVFASGETLPIGTYSYSTNSVQGRRGGKISLSLSSAGLQSNNPFYLKHVNSNGGTSARVTSHNSMMFYVYMTSQSGFSSMNPEERTVKFDGTLDYPLSGGVDCIIIPPETKVNIVGNSAVTSWFDNGDITFSIPSVQMINNDFLKYESLVSGFYTANIFVNIIPDF